MLLETSYILQSKYKSIIASDHYTKIVQVGHLHTSVTHMDLCRHILHSPRDLGNPYHSHICNNLGKNEGPLPKMLHSPADDTHAGGLESLSGPLAQLMNKSSTRGRTTLLQPSGKETLVPSAGLINIVGSGHSFFI